MATMALETRYAQNGDVNIAYQIVGSGPRDLIFVMGWISHLDMFWEEPRFARFLRRLASFSRVILIDKRGTGLSDRVPLEELPTLRDWMDDVRAVMDDAGSAQAVLLGISASGPMSAHFAATYPERTSKLIIYGGYAKRTWSPDYPWAPSPEERQEFAELVDREWGGAVDLAKLAPSAAEDESFRAWWASWLRHSASPGTALALARMNSQVDIRHILPEIRVPTLVIHRTGDLVCSVEGGRYLAEHIAGARMVELPGVDHLPFVGDQDAILDEIELFLTGERAAQLPDRLLTTLVVIELAGGAETALRLGDHQWGETRAAFHELVRHEFAFHQGQRLSATFDGSLATFDGPTRAMRFAMAVVAGARRLGISARAGLHTGEVALVGDDVAGVAVFLAVRIAALAEAGEILVSNTVRDLVADSGLALNAVGDQVFPNLPGSWRLYRLSVGAQDDSTLAVCRSVSESDMPRPLAILSSRERELAKLLALGLSNRQIADELVISVATVERHVANILTKLGYRSRAQVAAWAVEQGLLEAPN
jgi:pimeloyl-ACP methyl ester carboxylesterase/DNA-binding CsgD family transcriptional regulator/class 3 adenylate cyclase